MKNADLLSLAEEALKLDHPDIERATVAYNEVMRRNRKRVMYLIKEIFGQAGVKPIPWLAKSVKSLDVLEQPAPGVYQGHLYVVLITGFTEQNQFYGAYVGSSRYKPETRLQQHKAGINSSTIVRNRGLQILKSLCWPNGRPVPGGKNLIWWESALNRCLARVIPRVRGDFKPIAEWDDSFQKPLRALYEA
jgi:hypothetical protein